MERSAGVLLSVTSLPSRYGIGCFSKSAYEFVDWLEKAGQKYWQILPLGATGHAGSWDSPYQAYSAFAGNPYFISLEDLIDEGLLTRRECDRIDFGKKPDQVDYDALCRYRLKLLHRAYERSNISRDPGYQSFVGENYWWLEDYALFMAVKEFFGGVCWNEWPEDIRMHWNNALDYYRRTLYFDVEFQKFLQYKFAVQWKNLKAYANARGIEIIGDIPIYVSYDSADVWAHPELFQLDEKNQPKQVAGCPPDSFAPDGQLWGNPLYRWDDLEKSGYQWWITRMWYSFQLWDAVRIDHFRGFDEYFAIPAGDKTARNGHWEKGPGMKLFDAIRANLGERKIIAEDLGFLTETVRQMVRDSGFPNMKVLEFAFDPWDEYGENEYLPHRYDHNCVVYTGTHDNETVSGWFSGLSLAGKNRVRAYLEDRKGPAKEIPHRLIALAMASCADTCIIPIQDHLGLGNEARMNTPGTVGNNWSWRLKEGQLTPELADQVRSVSMRYGRVARKAAPAASEEA